MASDSKDTPHKKPYQRWFDYGYKGFHFTIELTMKYKNFEYPELIHVSERMIQRLANPAKNDQLCMVLLN